MSSGDETCEYCGEPGAHPVLWFDYEICGRVTLAGVVHLCARCHHAENQAIESGALVEQP